jgi:hypothetical protein
VREASGLPCQGGGCGLYAQSPHVGGALARDGREAGRAGLDVAGSVHFAFCKVNSPCCILASPSVCMYVYIHTLGPWVDFGELNDKTIKGLIVNDK